MWLSPGPAPSWAPCSQRGGQRAAQPMCRGLFSLPTSTVWFVRRSPGQPPDDSETPLSVPLESDIPTPLASRVAQGVSGPSSSCVWNPRVFADDARGWQFPFVYPQDTAQLFSV